MLLLLHGFGGSGRNFRPQARAFRDRFRVVLPDVRGHARSPDPDGPAACTAEALAADVASVLDRLDVERAVVGGLSMGAAIALEFALRAPERVRGLVLASFPGGRGSRGVASMALPFAEALENEGLEAAGARFVWGAESGLDPAGAALVRQGFLEHRPHALACVLRGYLAGLPPLASLAPALAEVAAPALVLAGSRDEVSLEPSRRLAALLPAARLVEIADAGHVVNLAAPAAFNAALGRFLDALPPERG